MHLYLSAALLGAAVIAAPVAATTTTTINFNAETQNNVASLTYPGVTITALGGGTVFTTTYSFGPNGTIGVLARNNNRFVPLRAAFSSLLSAVSVDIGDLGGDADTLFLRAYDSGNSLLGSASGSLAPGEAAMRTLSVTAANIAFIEFGGVGAFGESNLYADNLTFTTNAVPEPASWAMLMTGFGLAGAALRRRRAALAA